MANRKRFHRNLRLSMKWHRAAFRYFDKLCIRAALIDKKDIL